MKSDIELDHINTDRAYSRPRKPSYNGINNINAYDTETIAGDVVMLSYALGSTAHDEPDSGVVTNDGDQLEKMQIIRKLCHKRARSRVNVFYNLGFDADVILDILLDDEQKNELRTLEETSFEVAGVEYSVRYLDGKMLTIRDANNHVYTYYDISQFFYEKLEEALQTWTGETKADEEIETALFGPLESEKLAEEVNDSDKVEWTDIDASPGDEWTTKDAETYVMSRWGEVEHYAEQDAVLTQGLTEKIVTEAESLGIPMGKPISTGYMAMEFMRSLAWDEAWSGELADRGLDTDVDLGPQMFTDYRELAKEVTETDDDLEELKGEVGKRVSKPGQAPSGANRYLWEAYAGGRFEVIERGDVGRVAAPDINSAYPSVQSQLPDPGTLNWDFAEDDRANLEAVEDADYGAIKVVVSTDSDRVLQPFAVKDFTDEAKVKFPVLENKEVVVLRENFLHAVEEGLVTDYEIKDGWLGYETDDTERAYGWLEDLYATRYEYKDAGEMTKSKLIKTVINSVYGKTCETNWQTRVMDEEQFRDFQEDELDLRHQVHDRHLLGLVGEEWEGTYIVSELKAGPWFNPFMASNITGQTRLELIKQTISCGLENDIKMLATDCLMFDEEAYEQSDFHELMGDELGEWDFDYRGDAFIVGSGVYEVLTDDTDDDGERKLKTKTRGFEETQVRGSLREMAREEPGGITIKQTRPWSLNESILLADAKTGLFASHERKLTADFDSKRDWAVETPDFNDLLEDSHGSMPTTISDTARVSETAEEYWDEWEDRIRDDRNLPTDEVEMSDSEEGFFGQFS